MWGGGTIRATWITLGLCAVAGSTAPAEAPNKEMIDGLRPLASAVGAWKGDGSSEKSSGWKEKVECTWAFREKDGRASLNFYIEGGQILTVGLLTYDPKTSTYKFVGKNRKEEALRFEGKAADPTTLKLDRVDKEAADHLDRLELKLLRGGDKMMFDFRRKRGRNSFEQFAAVEMFREGGAEASADKYEKGPFCVVTGGPGRVSIEHEGKTVCLACESCKAEFLAHPERYPAAK